MDERILRITTEIVERYSGEREVQVSTQSTILIAQILNAIVADPHPSWQEMNLHEREQVVGSFFEGMPDILDRIAFTQRSYGRQITTFAVLHWLSENDNLNLICPILKELPQESLRND